MNEYSGLNSWIAIVNQKLPHLSRPQAKVLAMWSLVPQLSHRLKQKTCP
ncbi:hypothetical protein H6G91_19885 [Nostoc muscorum FACHB-395]|nr:hypothetical protein [Desmonostoc muscorum FACHB-395]